MKLIALCCLLLLGLLGFLAAPGAASPSRHTGPAGPSVPGSGNPFRSPSPQQRPLYYDAPVGKPSKTMYA